MNAAATVLTFACKPQYAASLCRLVSMAGECTDEGASCRVYYYATLWSLSQP